MVVLVDRATASASEIVAGALQDHKRAKLVGIRTFGKGVFQEVIPLSNGGALDITAGQYFTPKGRNLGRSGALQPDVRARDDPEPGPTRRWTCALKVLAKRAVSPRPGVGSGPRRRGAPSPCWPSAGASWWPSRSSTPSGPRERGGQMVVERDSRARVGDLVLVRAADARPRARADPCGASGDRTSRSTCSRRSCSTAACGGASTRGGSGRHARPATTGAARDDARRDLTDLPTFTIDPITAKDFDDAISAEVLDGGGTRVWVHIADVSAFVPAGSLVDREADRRGTSVYVPGRVEPMLPEALSNDACSLVPGQERAAVTVEMDFDGASVTRTAFHRSTILNRAALNYDRVDRIFAGEERREQPWAGPLAAARAVSAALQARRLERPALELDTGEPEFPSTPTATSSRPAPRSRPSPTASSST